MKVKMYVDFFLYLARIQKKETFILIIDLITFSIAAYTFFSEWVQNDYSKFTISLSLLFILLLIKLVYDTYKIVTDISKYKKSGNYEIVVKDRICVDDVIVELSRLIPCQTESVQGYRKKEIESQNDFVFHSKDVDRYIRNTSLSLKVNDKKRLRIQKLIMAEKELLLPFLNHQFAYSLFKGMHFYNQRKLCLSENIVIGNDQIDCHKGSYFDTFLTNHVCTRQLVTKDTNKVVYDGTRFFPLEYDATGIKLLELGFSDMNDEIGVSTIGITSDHYLFIWKQNSYAQSSNNLFVPTGSGSSDWQDIENGDFTQTIKNGMQRELWEESGKKSLGPTYQSIGETKVIGFFRWAKRGGKPEFVGITKLNAKSTQLEPELSEVMKPKVRHIWKIENVEQLKTTILEIKERKDISIPLYVNLISLENALEEDAEEIRGFLGIG